MNKDVHATHSTSTKLKEQPMRHILIALTILILSLVIVNLTYAQRPAPINSTASSACLPAPVSGGWTISCIISGNVTGMFTGGVYTRQVAAIKANNLTGMVNTSYSQTGRNSGFMTIANAINNASGLFVGR